MTALRAEVTKALRVVVKVGSSSLTEPHGGLDVARLDTLVAELSAVRARDVEIVLVSSGAIAAGIGPLGLAKRPRDLATAQAAASVGQGALVSRYAHAFAQHGATVGQVLLTVDDVVRRAHYRNAQRTLIRLLEMRAVPVINENDTVATDEIRFGDNDRLAALVAHLVHADLLVLLSDVDGLYDGDPKRGTARLLTDVRGDDDLEHVRIGGKGSHLGSGGMMTKVEAARIATGAGIPVVLASAAQTREVFLGEAVGTLFHATGQRRSTRLLWLAHATEGRGRLVLDAGAVKAVIGRRASLLPAGITAVEGSFVAGEPVDLIDVDGEVLARGLVNYDSTELPDLLGRSTRDLARELGSQYEREVVHRDDLVVLTGSVS